MRREIVLLAALVVSAGCRPVTEPAPVVEYGRLSGTVLLDDGRGAAGIEVQLVRRTNCLLCGFPGHDTLVQEATADEFGRFTLERVEVSEYYVEFGSYPDYQTWGDRGIRVRPDRMTTVEYVLRRRPEYP